MFVYFIFDGNFICRFLYILRPSSVPRSHFGHPKTKACALIISYLYLQILHSASGNDVSNRLEPYYEILDFHVEGAMLYFRAKKR